MNRSAAGYVLSTGYEGRQAAVSVMFASWYYNSLIYAAKRKKVLQKRETEKSLMFIVKKGLSRKGDWVSLCWVWRRAHDAREYLGRSVPESCLPCLATRGVNKVRVSPQPMRGKERQMCQGLAGPLTVELDNGRGTGPATGPIDASQRAQSVEDPL